MTDSRKQELEWIRRAKKDPRLFAPIYDRYFHAIFRFILSRTGDEELTADLTSQTFTKAMLAIKGYEDRGYSISSWLYRIALNEVNMHFRKAKKSKEVALDERTVVDLAEEATEGESRDPQLLIEALNELDETQVNLIELRFFEKKSFAEIGEIIAVAEDTAKMRVYRALKKLRALVLEKK